MQHFKALAKHSTIFSAAAFIKKGVGFIMIPVYTRFLMPEDYGLLELLDLTISVIAMIFGMRIGAGIIRFYHSYDELQDKKEVYSTALITMTLIALILLVVLQIFSHPIANLIAGSTEQVRAFQVMFGCLALQQIFMTGESYLLAQKKSVLYSALGLISFVIMLSLNILFLVFMGMGVYGVLLSMLIAKAINMVLVLFITLRGVPLRFSWSKLRVMTLYTLPLVPAGAAMFLLHFSDRFFIRHYVDLSELGLYALGYKFGMLINIFITAPIFSIWNTQRYEIAKQPDAGPVFARTFTWFVFVLVLAGLGISLFIDEVLHLVATERYDGASTVVPLIALAYITYSMAGFLNLGNMITGRTKYIMYIQVSVASLNILFNILLISRFGIMGAAVSTLLSFSILMVLNHYASQKALYVPYEYRRLTVLLAIGGMLFTLSLLVDGPLALVLLVKLVILAAYPALLFLARFFSQDEINAGKGLLRGVMNRMPFGARS